MTIQFAPDGIHFEVLRSLPNVYPNGPGAYRPDLTGLEPPEGGIAWGLGLIHGPDPFLPRYEIEIDQAVLDKLRAK